MYQYQIYNCVQPRSQNQPLVDLYMNFEKIKTAKFVLPTLSESCACQQYFQLSLLYPRRNDQPHNIRCQLRQVGLPIWNLLLSWSRFLGNPFTFQLCTHALLWEMRTAVWNEHCMHSSFVHWALSQLQLSQLQLSQLQQLIQHSAMEEVSYWILCIVCLEWVIGVRHLY